jgi:hypothetical protein
MVDLLSGLNGLQLNDLIANNGANALSTLGRSGDSVTANGLGQVAHIDVLKLNDSYLTRLLGATELASVDGIKATANVSLDGVSAAKQSANGSLLDVKVLGHSLSSLTGGKLALDDILPAGTSCTINIPGTSTCKGVTLSIPPAEVSALLGQIQTATSQTLPTLPTLLTVTLTRGAGVVDQSNSTKFGRADITVLQITSNINCDAVSKVATALQPVQSTLASTLDLHLAACGVGVTDTPAAPAGANKANVAPTYATGNQPLVNVALGTAHAEVNLTSGSTPDTFVGGPVPPTTGNDLLILAGIALAALAGGVALQARKARA